MRCCREHGGTTTSTICSASSTTPAWQGSSRAVANLAKRSNKSAEQMVVDNQYFATFWTHKVEALTDVCRQLQAEGSVGSGFPSIFLTIAPSRVELSSTSGMLEWCAKAKLLSNSHSLLTLHIYNGLTSVLQAVLKNRELLDDWGIKTIFRVCHPNRIPEARHPSCSCDHLGSQP